MWWPGGPTINDAQAVVAPATVDVSLPLAGTLVGTLMRGAQISGIDATLAPGVVLTGRVVDAMTNQPLAGVCPAAFAGRSGDVIPYQQPQCSQADGRWRVSGLPAGATTVRLRYYPQVEIWAYSSTTQAKATVFELTAGTTTTLRGVKLRLPRSE
jgi:hypothetical protein